MVLIRSSKDKQLFKPQLIEWFCVRQKLEIRNLGQFTKSQFIEWQIYPSTSSKKKKSVNGIGSPGDKINIITAFKIHLDAF